MNEELKQRVEVWHSNYISGTKDAVQMLDEANLLIKQLVCHSEFMSSLATPDDYTRERNELYTKQVKDLTNREAKLIATIKEIDTDLTNAFERLLEEYSPYSASSKRCKPKNIWRCRLDDFFGYSNRRDVGAKLIWANAYKALNEYRKRNNNAN